MDVTKMMELSYDDLRALFMRFLRSQDIQQSTINTAYSDAFYLWRTEGKDLFWKVVNAPDFEIEARRVLSETLSKHLAVNAEKQVSGYLSHLRKFRQFLSSDEPFSSVASIRTAPIKTQAGYKRRYVIKTSSKPLSREIIINKMYNGNYLLEGGNIGHEIINLYKADDGKNYIYLNSQGTIELSHGDSILTVLMVRKTVTNTYKVLAKAEGVWILGFADSRLPRQERYQGQLDLGLTYDGVRLVDIFDQNVFRGSIEDEKNAYTTFVADKVIKPKDQLYITDDESLSGESTIYIRTTKGFGSQTLREYYNEFDKPDSFTDLNQIIENGELWEDADTTQKISELPKILKDPYFNFLNIIRKEDDELVFSNMFAYYFDHNREAFSRFAREVLHVDIQPDFVIKREKRNIDLLISDKKHVVAIENKIKSSINGVDERHDINSDLVQSQLNKYYEYITADDEYRVKIPCCFVFLPNHNRIDLSKFSCGEKYRIVYYREIHRFFVANKDLFEGVPYFDDFVHAMYKHTKDIDNDLEEEMQRRFLVAIHKVKSGMEGRQI